MRLAVLAGALAAALAASAPASAATLRGNIDGDAAKETVTTVDTPAGTSVRVQDTCPSGAPVNHEVAGPHGRLVKISLVSVDPRPGLEILVHLRKGGPFSSGNLVRLIAWRAQGADGCPAPRTLFGFTGMGKRPHAGDKYAGFNLRIGALSKRWDGQEIAFDELFAGRGRPRRDPDVMRRNRLRYDPARDAYRRYSRRVTRIPGS